MTERKRKIFDAVKHFFMEEENFNAYDVLTLCKNLTEHLYEKGCFVSDYKIGEEIYFVTPESGEDEPPDMSVVRNFVVAEDSVRCWGDDWFRLGEDCPFIDKIEAQNALMKEIRKYNAKYNKSMCLEDAEMRNDDF